MDKLKEAKDTIMGQASNQASRQMSGDPSSNKTANKEIMGDPATDQGSQQKGVSGAGDPMISSSMSSGMNKS
ncbi:hypothetical protein AAE478_002538 [Parahypoxylon ruwenzoriense]